MAELVSRAVLERIKRDKMAKAALDHPSSELLKYISAYVNEELDRGKPITADTIKQSINAFHGGAR